MRRLDSITKAMDMSFCKLQTIVKDWEAWPAAVHWVAKCQTSLNDWTTSTVSKSVLPMFSSKSFRDYGLPFRSLNHFEFIFVYGVTKKQLLFSCAILGFALPGPWGSYAWWQPFSPLPHVREPFPPPWFFSPLVGPVCPFSCTSPGSRGKWLAQGLTEGRQINTLLIRKKKR